MNTLTLEQHIQHQHQMQSFILWVMGAFGVFAIILYISMALQSKRGSK
jgi:hypothetical protein